MSGGTLAWGCTAAALCVVVGILIGWPIGHWRGMRHAAEDAEDAAWRQTDAEWEGLADATPDPAPLPVQPVALHAGPGKHRNPPGPRHAALPAAGYLPAPELVWWDGKVTVPAPAQSPPWDIRPAEPQAEVLEPTAVLPPPDPLTDSAFTRGMAADMDAWIAEHITATDSVLKEITGGAR